MTDRSQPIEGLVWKREARAGSGGTMHFWAAEKTSSRKMVSSVAQNRVGLQRRGMMRCDGGCVTDLGCVWIGSAESGANLLCRSSN